MLCCKDGFITLFAQDDAIPYDAYLLKEASFLSSDCGYEQPFAFSFRVQKSRRRNPQIQPRLEPLVFSL